jgi:hypothetical protein
VEKLGRLRDIPLESTGRSISTPFDESLNLAYHDAREQGFPITHWNGHLIPLAAGEFHMLNDSLRSR